MGHSRGRRIGIKRTLHWRFLVRGFGLALLFIALIGFGGWLFLRRITPQIPFGPTPGPPAIGAPRASLPEAPAGLEEWAKYRGAPHQRVGSGFLFTLEAGEILAATTAHSLRLGDDQAPLESVAFAMPEQQGFLFESTHLHGEPGIPRLFGLDLTGDYVLLRVEVGVPAELVLTPDPRGAPQPGERVLLYSGMPGGEGLRRLSGNVLSVDDQGAWVVMDEVFDPGLMSGSPFVSAHTGQVVGMAVAAGSREGYVVIGMHPIGSLVKKALRATGPRRLSDYGE